VGGGGEIDLDIHSMYHHPTHTGF